MQIQLVLKYPVVFATGFLVTLLVTPMVRRLAAGVGFMDVPGTRHPHGRPTPLGGGIAVFLGFHAACAIVLAVPWAPFRGLLAAVWWWQFLLLSSLLLFLGLLDDALNIKPFLKLAGQTAVAAGAFLCGMRVESVLGADLPVMADFAFTLIWFLTLINAFNLIDGLDGLAAGLAAIASLGLVGSFLFRYRPGDALILFGLCGACIAFLRYNYHPASVFLGDSGSMFLGFTLASVALRTGAKGTAIAALFVPLLAVGVPVFDVALAVWRRTVRRMLPAPEAGAKPAGVFQGDTEHLHHRLLRAGLSQKAAATWLYAAGVVLVAVGFLSMLYHSHAVGIYTLAFLAAVYVVVRHLARVELLDSGRAIVNGLRKPPSRVLAGYLYPVLDVLALSTALALSLALVHEGSAEPVFRRYWLDRAPVWVGIPFLALLFSGTYHRIWSRARVSEYVVLVLALGGGALFASAVASFMPALSVDGLFRHAAVFTGIAVSLIAGIRALPRAVQDGLIWVSRRDQRGGANRPVLVYGARYGCMVFLLERSYALPGEPNDFDIVGLLDDDRNLHGRVVHGYRVLGGIEALRPCIQKLGIRTVIVTDPLRSGVREQLAEIGAETGLELLRWQTVISPLPGTNQTQ